MIHADLLFEIYGTASVLLALSGLVLRTLAKRLRTPIGVREARLVLASCLIAPLLLCFVPPAHGPLLGRSSERDMQPTRTSQIFQDRTVSIAELSTPTTVVLPFGPVRMDPLAVLASVLAIGTICAVVRFQRDLRRIRLLLRQATTLRQRGKVRILVSQDVVVPFAVRFPRTAYILLPVGLLGHPKETLIALCHEGQHHRQGDCIYAYGLEILRALFPWHPAAHWWCRFLGDLQEFSCDEALIGRQLFSPHDYGRCLLTVAQAAQAMSGLPTQFRPFAGAVGMAYGSSDALSILRRRIVMLPRYKAAGRGRRVRVSAVVAASICLHFGFAYAARGSLAGPSASDKVEHEFLDPRLEALADQELNASMAKFRAKSGVIAVIEPSTGHLVAFSEAHAEGDSSETWAERSFAPGSTIKPFVLAAAMERGVTTPETIYDCSQPYAVGGTKFVNYRDRFHNLNATRVIADSVNIGAIKIAQDAGVQQLRSTLAAFGIDSAPYWRSDVSESLQLARTALGESVPTSVLGLAHAYATLARHGKAADGASVISESTAAALQKILLEVVNSGTGKHAALTGVEVAGKTGSINGGVNAYSRDEAARHLALFAGYAPASAPKLVTVVIFENARTSDGDMAGGGAAAAPLFHDFMAKALQPASN